MYQLLKLKSNGLKKEAIGFTRELVAIPSVSLNEKQAAEFVERGMSYAGFDRVFRDECGNVVGLIMGRSAGPNVLLLSHLDTVLPPDEKAGLVEDDYLYGSGSSDCKSGVAAHVFTGCLLKRSLLPLNGNLIVAATVAEENGCSVGTKWLMEKTLPQLGLKADYVVLGETTGLGLYYGHDGWVELDVKVVGSNPFKVGDAADSIFNDIDTISRENERENFDSWKVNKPFIEENRGLREATITVERRMNLSEDMGYITSQLKHEAVMAAKNNGSVAIDVAVKTEFQKLYTGHSIVVKKISNAWSIDPFCQLMEKARGALKAAGCKAEAGKWKLGRLGMGTSGSVILNEFKIPVIGYGPGDEDSSHTENERVKIDNITEAVYGTSAIVHSLIGIPVFGWSSDEI
ncbi:MAG: M20/M25/M40 family metallo-hydrolase [Phycisphaerae bacterium]